MQRLCHFRLLHKWQRQQRSVTTEAIIGLAAAATQAISAAITADSTRVTIIGRVAAIGIRRTTATGPRRTIDTTTEVTTGFTTVAVDSASHSASRRFRKSLVVIQISSRWLHASGS